MVAQRYSRFAWNDHVKIVRGKYKGGTGSVVGETMVMVYVMLETGKYSDVQVRLWKDSVRVAPQLAAKIEPSIEDDSTVHYPDPESTTVDLPRLDHDSQAALWLAMRCLERNGVDPASEIGHQLYERAAINYKHGLDHSDFANF